MKITNSKKGFTIIEVVLVLAIAGMIFLVVFLAVPQLQESRRDNQRRSDVSRIMAQLESFATNNNGNYPNSTAANCANGSRAVDDFQTNYLSSADFTSPSGNDYSFNCDDSTNPAISGSDETLVYGHSRVCDGETFATSGGNDRTVAIRVLLEGGGTFCIDNQ